MNTTTKLPKAPAFDLYSDGSISVDARTEWQEGGFRMVATVEYDEDAELGHLGQYFRKEGEAEVWAHRINRPVYTITYRSRVYRNNAGRVWFVPEQTDPEYARQDAARVKAFLEDEWTFYTLTVRAYRAGIELGENSRHGIESDSGDYWNEAARECGRDAMHEARKALIRLCEGDA